MMITAPSQCASNTCPCQRFLKHMPSRRQHRSHGGSRPLLGTIYWVERGRFRPAGHAALMYTLFLFIRVNSSSCSGVGSSSSSVHLRRSSRKTHLHQESKKQCKRGERLHLRSISAHIQAKPRICSHALISPQPPHTNEKETALAPWHI